MVRILLLIAACCSLLSARVSAQQTDCSNAIPPQQAWNCSGCTNESTKDFVICLNDTTYTVTVYYCNQSAFDVNPPRLIKNPCTPDCTLPVDMITWVRKVCVPPALYTTSASVIYQALLQATDLCCDNWLLANIPWCGDGKSCFTTLSPYCHVMAFPTCVSFLNGCWQPCGGNCENVCIFERRYCRQGPAQGPFQCVRCPGVQCTINDVTCDVASGCRESVTCTNLTLPTSCCTP